MIRRAYIIGTVALVLTLTALQTSPAYYRLRSSTHSFRQYFHDLNRAESSLNPVERVVFSLALANAESQPEK